MCKMLDLPPNFFFLLNIPLSAKFGSGYGVGTMFPLNAKVFIHLLFP